MIAYHLKRIKNILLATLLILTGSCADDLTSDEDKKQGQLVLFAFLTPDSTFSVHLSRSVEYSSIDDFERIYDGYIVVERNNIKVDSFSYPFRNLWAERSDITVRQNDVFNIKAGDSGGNISGSVAIPQAVPIERIDTSRVNALDMQGVMQKYLECDIIFTDPLQSENFYQLVLSEEIWDESNGSLKYSRQQINYLKSDSVFYIKDKEGSLLAGIDFKGTFSDYKINGHTYPLKIRIPAWYAETPAENQKRRITFMLLSQTSDYFKYLQNRIIAEYNYDLPIIDPVKIHSNIDGGLGLIGGISVACDSLVFINGELKIENEKLRFLDAEKLRY